MSDFHEEMRFKENMGKILHLQFRIYILLKEYKIDHLKFFYNNNL